MGVLGCDDAKNGIPGKVDISNDDVRDYGLLLGVNQWVGLFLLEDLGKEILFLLTYFFYVRKAFQPCCKEMRVGRS